MTFLLFVCFRPYILSAPVLGITLWGAILFLLMNRVLTSLLRSSRRSDWRALFASGIFLALPFALHAGNILGPKISGGGSPTPSVTPTTITSSSPKALAAANDPLSRATIAFQSVQILQAQAHAIAIAGVNNLGVDPNHSGLILPNVPNGLVAGGLVPGLVTIDPANPVPISTVTTSAGSTSTFTVPTSPTSKWVGISGLSQTMAPASGTASPAVTVTVTQSQQDALLTWQSFNIGKNTTLDFNQSAGGSNVGSWIAVNEITDPSGVPSQILGQIQAPGQVYVINQNGIIFGGSSEVNTHALVASSLPIDGNLSNPGTGSGLLVNPDYQFLFSQLSESAGTLGPTPAFTPGASPLQFPSGTGGTLNHDGDVTVQAGAVLTSPASVDDVGGKIALIGPNVTNNGTINTPDGQTILAAGLQVGLVAHNSADASLRGLDVYVGQISDPTYSGSAGTVTNGSSSSTGSMGIINAPEGDVMLVGANVNQNGIIASSTSVALNGRIDLLADYGTEALTNTQTDELSFFPTQSGTVTLGANSVTDILPESSSGATVVGSSLALTSIVDLQGESVTLDDAAQLIAPGASLPVAASGSTAVVPLTYTTPLSAGVSLNAGTWVSVSGTEIFSNVPGVSSPSNVTLDSGSLVDVAGSQDNDASVTENIISAQLLGTELADFPVQQASILRGKTIMVDIGISGTRADGSTYYGTPIADLSGYLNDVQHTVSELTANGGTVALSAGNGVNLNSGSTVNVSGGFINYQGATVDTSTLVSGGNLVNIASANPNIAYSGIENGFTTLSPKYGITTTFSSPLVSQGVYEAGYTQGGNGGSLTIVSPTMSISGTLAGNTTAGSQQVRVVSNVSAEPLPEQRTDLPSASSLNLNFEENNPASSTPLIPPTTATDIVIGDDTGIAAASGHALLDLSPDLIGTDGFGSLAIVDYDGNVTLPADVSMTGLPDARLAISAANITIDGEISLPGGSIQLNAYNVSPLAYAIATQAQGAFLPAVAANRGDLILGPDAALSTAGLVIDDRVGSNSGTTPLASNGGTITLSGFNTDLNSCSTINVSGGAQVSTSDAISAGSAGAISIAGGRDPGVTALVGGQLSLGSTLEGYTAGTTGGALTIIAPLIDVAPVLANGAAIDSVGNTVSFAPGFFDQGGFGTFNLEGIGVPVAGQAFTESVAVQIAPDTQLAPVAESYLVQLGMSGVTLTPTQYGAADVSLRPPVSLSFDALGFIDPGSATNAVQADLIMGAGSSITTDPHANVSLAGNTVTVLGSVLAPGGKITVTGGADSSLLFGGSKTAQALPTVEIGSGSTLSVAGAAELTPNALGFTTGSVLAGGSIAISGNIVAEAGSTLNVSGSSAVLDLPVGQGSLLPSFSPTSEQMIPTLIASEAGTITLTSAQELLSDATLIGISPAGATAAGGSQLTVSANTFLPAGASTTVNQFASTLTITQANPTYTGATGSSLIGEALQDGSGNALNGGYLSANSFNQSGLNTINLEGDVKFSGSVSLIAPNSITVGNKGIIYGTNTGGASTVTLTAPYVELGTPFAGPLTAVEESDPLYTLDGNPAYIAPTYGSVTLDVNAGLIDVGNTNLQGIGTTSLNAVTSLSGGSYGGDIRGDGTLDVAGQVTLTAGQIYPTTESVFSVIANDYNGVAGSGGVTVLPAGTGLPQLPLSGGGTLNIYASNINQGGVLRAPIGTINLGSGVVNSGVIDPFTGLGVDATQSLTLTDGSVTSVSAVDPTTGQALIIPYGTNVNGVAFTDPSGVDITTDGGIPSKQVNVQAAQVKDETGAVIDTSGGGDLFAYQFVPGTGGDTDVLASSSSFAIVPGYQAAYAPFYTPASSAVNDTGYSASGLAVGSQVYLGAGSGLTAGVYTLLPARYALLPGAFLVTPEPGTPTGAVAQTDGSTLVSGYRFNGLNPAQVGQPVTTNFDIASAAVVKSRADYVISDANTFLSASAISAGLTPPRLPEDAGTLLLAATQSMIVDGTLSAQPASGGLGGQVDIASPTTIVIAGSNGNTYAGTGDLVLNASLLSDYGADSLLIGGYRTDTTAGTQVTVTTGNLIVDNAGEPLTGPDIVLVSNGDLTVMAGAEVEQLGTSTQKAENLLLGTAANVGSGDGTLVRVSSDATATTSRVSVDSGTAPDIQIDAGSVLTGNSLTVDSTSATQLSSQAMLTGRTAVNLDSGQVSFELSNPGTLQPTTGLVLSNQALTSLLATTQSLSILSYSSLDFYGNGQIGGLSSSGAYLDSTLTLHAAGIRGFSGDSDPAVTIYAQNIDFDNSASGTVSGVVPASTAGSLTLDAATIELGSSAETFTGSYASNANVITGVNVSNLTVGQAITGAGIPAGATITAINGTSISISTLTESAGTASALSVPTPISVEGYENVALNASGGVQVSGTGGLTTGGNLAINTPVLSGLAAANQSITAAGTLTLSVPSVVTAAPFIAGLGVTLNLQGSSVDLGNSITLPSGDLSVVATSGDLQVSGQLNAAGTFQAFYDLDEYTSGGQISLSAAAGSVALETGSLVNVMAQAGGGNAGTLTISAPAGTFTAAGALAGTAGAGGEAGTFSLDVGTITAGDPTGNVDGLNALLNTDGFTDSRSIRVRNGNMTISGLVHAATVNFSTDNGSITVANGGTIDASGSTGGTIDLSAGGVAAGTGSITLAAGSTLSVYGTNFNDAGKGGAIELAAGSASAANFDPSGNYTPNANAFVDIETGSVINLGVGQNSVLAAGNTQAEQTALNQAAGDFTGTLHLRAPQTSSGTDAQINPINGTIEGSPSNVTIEGFYAWDLTGGTITSAAETAAYNNGVTFGNNSAAITSRLLNNTPNAGLAGVTTVNPGAELDNTTGSLTLSADWDLYGNSANAAAQPAYRFGTELAPGYLTIRGGGQSDLRRQPKRWV